MGVVCCNKVTNENKCSELAIAPDPSGIFLRFFSNLTELGSKTGDAFPKLGRCKTIAKKEQRKFIMPKTATDSISITPSQFVLENQGILSDCYQFVKQLGQG